jgi:hypothetical protein
VAEELPCVVVDEPTFAILGGPAPPQPATTSVTDTSTTIPTAKQAEPSPLRAVSSVAKRTSEGKQQLPKRRLKPYETWMKYAWWAMIVGRANVLTRDQAGTGHRRGRELPTGRLLEGARL